MLRVALRRTSSSSSSGASSAAAALAAAASGVVMQSPSSAGRLAPMRAFSSLPARLTFAAAPATVHSDDLVLDSVAEAGFFSQHRPLAVQLQRPTHPHSGHSSLLDGAAAVAATPAHSVLDAAYDAAWSHSADPYAASAALAAEPAAASVADGVIDVNVAGPHSTKISDNADWYNDEYAKMFNSFAPFADPTSAPPTMPAAQDAAVSSSKAFLNETQLLDAFFKSFESLDLSSASSTAASGAAAASAVSTTYAMLPPNMDLAASGRRRREHASMALAARLAVGQPMSAPGSPDSDAVSMVLRQRKFNIIKIRRKKMNKHKWKKYRRRVRNSSRYNKEKLRKGGIQRKKQE
ncbi:hypothetical protein BC831DRAFT_503477 [Entophlyctis helioformis]|nr:hypothetical protein BC831DRAFT_503477 [Entophlyctis helioformis]